MALIAGIGTESGQLAEVMQILVETNLYEANPGGRMVQLFPGHSCRGILVEERKDRNAQFGVL